jgi:cytochrome c
MSAMEINKFIGAILLVLIVIKVADLVADAGGAPEPMAKPAYVLGGTAPAEPEAKAKPASKPGTKSETKSGTKPAPAAKPTESKPKMQTAGIGALLAAASPDKGKAVARKCTICHSVKKGGKNKVGPALWGVVGAKKARGTFRFSKALKALGGNWDYAALDGFLKSPRAFVPGNKMTFPGIKGDGDRAALILYLRSLSDSPIALP